MKGPVLLASVVVHVIHSEVVPPVEAVEGAWSSVRVERKQRLSILWLEPDVPTKGYAWSAELPRQQEQPPVLKVKALLP